MNAGYGREVPPFENEDFKPLTGYHPLTVFMKQIRLYRRSDLETLFRIDQACFPPQVSYSRDELARFIGHQNSRTWVGQDGNEIVGFIVATRHPQKVGHIITIDVIESRRRTGIGTALMERAEDWARREGLRSIYLETAEQNLPAQRFYFARGYVKVEEVENYYSDGQTAWVMVKWLRIKKVKSGP